MHGDDVVAHGVDHLQGAVGGVVAFDVAGGDVDGEELRAHPALLHAREIGHVVGVGLADVHAGDGGAGDVVVGVDEEGAFVDALHFGVGDGALLAAGSLGGEECGGERRAAARRRGRSHDESIMSDAPAVLVSALIRCRRLQKEQEAADFDGRSDAR